MAEFEVLPMFTGDLIADTLDFDDAEFGAYVRILIALWRNRGRLPYDPEALRKIAHTTRYRWPKVWMALMPKFIIAGGQVSQKRLTDILLTKREISRKRAVVGRKGGYAKWRKNLRIAWDNPLK